MSEYKDKKGKLIKPGCVLKIFHFIGGRRKRHYMYKVAIEVKGELLAFDIYELALLGQEKAHRCRMMHTTPAETEIIAGDYEDEK
jgi:hypothetical protein